MIVLLLSISGSTIAQQDPAHRGWIWSEAGPRVQAVEPAVPRAPEPPPPPKPERSWRTDPIVLHDVDGDSSPDMLLRTGGMNTENNAWVLSGRTGAILSRATLPSWTRSLDTCASGGDFDGDGWEDWLGFAHGSGVVISSRTGDVLEEPPPWSAPCMGVWRVAGDVDGDGRTDLLVIDRDNFVLHVVSGSSGRVWAEIPVNRGRGLFLSDAVMLGDLDGDGHRDVAVDCIGPGNEEHTIGVLLSGTNWTSRRVEHVRSAPSGMTVRDLVDVDADGVADVAVSTIERRVRVFSGCTLANKFSIHRSFDDGRPTLDMFGRTVDAFIGPRGQAYLLVGVPDAGMDDGAVERWSIDARRTRLVLPSPPEDDNWHFGSLLEVIGDVNGDGVPDFMAAPDHGMCGNPARLYVCSGSTGEVFWSVERSLTGISVRTARP